MQFKQIINAKISKEADRMQMQKEVYTVKQPLEDYLAAFGRSASLPLVYKDLQYYSHTNMQRDNKGKLTHWEAVVYDEEVAAKLFPQLIQTYLLLKKQDAKLLNYRLSIAEVSLCEFGNSIPYRIIVEDKEQNFRDRYYIKLADASRIYGLELEHLLAPGATNFIYDRQTLVEEHIEGLPGDVFLKERASFPINEKSIATEFILFNERCFARLLGDMRSYNFVAAITEEKKLKLRPIDFDQQSYEGKCNLYMAQFFKENYEFVQLVLQHLTQEEVAALQQQERQTMRQKMISNIERMEALMEVMTMDEISEKYKVVLLKKELNEYFSTENFTHCESMGALVIQQLKQLGVSQNEAGII